MSACVRACRPHPPARPPTPSPPHPTPPHQRIYTAPAASPVVFKFKTAAKHKEVGPVPLPPGNEDVARYGLALHVVSDADSAKGERQTTPGWVLHMHMRLWECVRACV